MSEAPTHRQFFGDDEYAFALTPDLMIELERKTGTGIGGLCRRLFAGDFRHVEVLETIRLALIGGGAEPENASALVATYAATKPLGETFLLAVAILETAWFGTPETQEINVRPPADEKEANRAA